MKPPFNGLAITFGITPKNGQKTVFICQTKPKKRPTHKTNVIKQKLQQFVAEFNFDL